VVDSEDLPLNISREMLQNNPLVAQMRKTITGRIVAELETLAEKDQDQFSKVWEAFGSVIKEGIYEDDDRRDQLLALARFATTAGDEPRSLKQVVADMKPNQEAVYYLVGDSVERLKANPKLEAAKARGVEVLLLTDHVDAFWTAMPLSFEGKPLKSLSQGEVDLDKVPLLDGGTEAPGKPVSSPVDDAVIIATVKAALGDQVADVKASQRLTDSPSCLIADRASPDRELERILQRANRVSGSKPILELNMRHELVREVAAAKAAGRDSDAGDLALLLLEQARILDGELPADPAAFARNINRLILAGVRAGGG
jgi:molecular chaperone HtpG